MDRTAKSATHPQAEDPHLGAAARDHINAPAGVANTAARSGIAERERLWSQFERFILEIHAHLDLDQTAYAIANDGRSLIGCDRLAVVLRRGRRCRLLAVSGLDVFDRRSNVVRGLEELASAVLGGGDALWHDGRDLSLPPQIHQPLSAHLDQSHARTLAVLPLLVSAEGRTDESAEAIGALVVERLDESADEEFRRRAAAVAEHAAPALGNAIAHSNVPRPVRALFGPGGPLRPRHLSRGAMVLIVIAMLVAALVLIPADLEIEARGELQPARRRDVFAPADGVVDGLPVAENQQVAPGDALVVLRDPQLELEFARVRGEEQTAVQKLAAVRAARSEQVLQRSDELEQYRRLTAEEGELKQQLESLERQLEILQRQQSELTVASPLGGQVLNWNLERLLAGRPVRRGTLLMTVADLDGPWMLELQIDDDEAGHVLQARAAAESPLPVTYYLASQPGSIHAATLDELGAATEMDAEGRPVVRAGVGVERNRLPALRPGTTVTAKIHCGRRSLGYVWFHDLFDAVRSYVLF